MSSIEIISKIEALKEWETILEEAKAEVESIKDSIKKEMDSQGVEELEAGQFIARFTTVVSNRLDTTALKRENAALYQRYLKQSTSRRFSMSYKEVCYPNRPKLDSRPLYHTTSQGSGYKQDYTRIRSLFQHQLY